MKRLLVNADDFGLHADIDAGIIDCIRAGAVCGISFSPNGKSLDWACLAVLQGAGIDVGLHVTLVGEPWLTDGRVIAKWPQLGKQLLTGGQAIRAAVAREIDAQFAAADNHGIKLDHVDSHQHVHVFGAVWRPMIAAAERRDVPRVRVPWAPSFGAVKRTLGGMALQIISSGRRAQRPESLPCIGLAHAGHNTGRLLARELSEARQAGGGSLELVAHPARATAALEAAYPSWHFDWQSETAALTSDQFKQAVHQNGYEIPPFGPVPAI